MVDKITNKQFFKIMKKDALEETGVLKDTEFYEAFPYWILKIFFAEELSEDQKNEAVNGLQSNDESIDAFWINEEMNPPEVNIAQFKSCNSELNLGPAKKEWFDFLSNVPQKLENDEFMAQHKNETIQDIAKQFRDLKEENEEVKINFYFFHLGHLGNNSQLSAYDDSFYYYGFDEIKAKWFEYESLIGSHTSPMNITLELKKNETMKPLIGNTKTLITLITGKEIVKLRQQYGYALFNENVRFSVGKNKINKEITKTAQQEPEHFYFYNNGITIICKNIRDGNKIENLQIINGAQTVEALYNAHKELTRKKGESAESLLAKIKVLVRIIATGNSTKDLSFSKNIVRYNNSQNIVKPRDFYSNSSEQIKLQKAFAELGYYYEIKRGAKNYLKISTKNEDLHLKKTQKEFSYFKRNLDIEKIASSYRAYLGECSTKETGAQLILSDDKIYQKIFLPHNRNYKELVVKMSLAFNLFSLIENETKKYKKLNLSFQKFQKEKNDMTFNDLNSHIQASYFLAKGPKVSRFKNHETYQNFKNDETEKNPNDIFLQERRDVATQGKYLIIGLIARILTLCGYEKDLLHDNRVHNESWLSETIIQPWLPTIMTEILVPLVKGHNDSGVGIRALLLREDAFKKAKNEFLEKLGDGDQTLQEVFPLNK